jgi:hypothetical protein
MSGVGHGINKDYFDDTICFRVGERMFRLSLDEALVEKSV